MADRPAPTFRTEVRDLLRDRLLDAAAAIIVADGWTAVTMAKLADAVGVSRQTVYNELGTRPRLAEALVHRELDRFLEIVRGRLAGRADVVDAVRAACEGALQAAVDSPLLKAVLDAAHTGGNDLLPLLTTRSQELIETAGMVVLKELHEQRLTTPLDEARLRIVVDAVVRLVLSHVMQPVKSPAEAAADLAWLVAPLVGGQDSASR